MLNLPSFFRSLFKGRTGFEAYPRKLNLGLQGHVSGDDLAGVGYPVPGCSPKALWGRSAVLTGLC